MLQAFKSKTIWGAVIAAAGALVSWLVNAGHVSPGVLEPLAAVAQALGFSLVVYGRAKAAGPLFKGDQSGFATVELLTWTASAVAYGVLLVVVAWILAGCGTTAGESIKRYGQCVGSCALKCLNGLEPAERLKVLEAHGIDPAAVNPPPEKVEPTIAE